MSQPRSCLKTRWRQRESSVKIIVRAGFRKSVHWCTTLWERIGCNRRSNCDYERHKARV